MALTWPQGKKKRRKGRPINLGGLFATFEDKVIVVKYHHFDEFRTLGSKLLDSCPKVVKSFSCCCCFICFYNENNHHHQLHYNVDKMQVAAMPQLQ
jgi:hypothetical protein